MLSGSSGGPPHAVEELSGDTDDSICVHTTESVLGKEGSSTTTSARSSDDEARILLEKAEKPPSATMSAACAGRDEEVRVAVGGAGKAFAPTAPSHPVNPERGVGYS